MPRLVHTLSGWKVVFAVDGGREVTLASGDKTKASMWAACLLMAAITKHGKPTE